MTSEQVTQLVETEIAGDMARSNAHGVDLDTCLVPPRQQHYADSWEPGKQLTLWLVLQEDPTNHAGYEIVFDEQADMFGLATSNIFIGYYGTFLETLEGM